MISISVNEEHSYIELDVYGAYDEAKLGEFFDAAQRLVARHGYFSELEVHHGKIQAFSGLSMVTKEAQKRKPGEMEFLAKMKKYALVADEPGLLLRFAAAISAFGGVKMKLFAGHERDKARAWIEGRDDEQQIRV